MHMSDWLFLITAAIGLGLGMFAAALLRPRKESAAARRLREVLERGEK